MIDSSRKISIKSTWWGMYAAAFPSVFQPFSGLWTLDSVKSLIQKLTFKFPSFPPWESVVDLLFIEYSLTKAVLLQSNITGKFAGFDELTPNPYHLLYFNCWMASVRRSFCISLMSAQKKQVAAAADVSLATSSHERFFSRKTIVSLLSQYHSCFFFFFGFFLQKFGLVVSTFRSPLSRSNERL